MKPHLKYFCFLKNCRAIKESSSTIFPTDFLYFIVYFIREEFWKESVVFQFIHFQQLYHEERMVVTLNLSQSRPRINTGIAESSHFFVVQPITFNLSMKMFVSSLCCQLLCSWLLFVPIISVKIVSCLQGSEASNC